MATNITFHPSTVTAEERASLRGQRGLTLWLTGLSASGKSTIAVALEQALLRAPYKLSAYRLDGDNIRFGLNKDLGFSPKDREENIRRIAEVAKLFADSTAIAITSFISPYRADRDLARDLHDKAGHPFVEVWIDVPVEVAEKRDPKGLYKKAREGKIPEFTGISAPYEEPLKAEIHIKSAETSVEDAVKIIVKYLEEKGYLTAPPATTLVATNKIKPDPAQHRLALQLQKLYFRLKDYSPELEYRDRLEQISRSLSQKTQHVSQQGRGFFLSSLFRRAADGGRSTLSLTRTLPIHDSALSIDSPQGMLLYGEVGRGKSMLLDLLYNSLPNGKKRRWHFNTFMLDIFRRLELSRIERAASDLDFKHEHVILTLARDSVVNSPILFLDEFQMPDRTASKLLNGFVTSFFHLGGVLVASSNRMPDELAKASGIEFQRDRSTSGRGMFGWDIKRLSDGQKAAQSDFGMFLEVLKARCEIWQMEGERDWRREEDVDMEEEVLHQDDQMGLEQQSSGNEAGFVISPDSIVLSGSEARNLSSDAPPHYHVFIPSSPPTAFVADVDRLNPSGAWFPKTLNVYSRPLQLSRTNSNIAFATFDELCARTLGPADYTSLCSHFHTLILTDVPVLTMTLKNEARRFITLLDALYEARCRLLIEAAAPPDKLFFPETRTRHAAEAEIDSGDSIESEAYSEVYQDSTAPFRPNISLYSESNDGLMASALPTSSQLRSVLADEDADFGPTYGNGRSHGASSNDLAEIERQQAAQQGIGPDFTNVSTLIGQDEMFAFKRARSRLWEMCGRKWWHDRSGPPEKWWTPLSQDGRFWERPTDGNLASTVSGHPISGEGMHDVIREQGDDLSGDLNGSPKHGRSLDRQDEERHPPQFGFWHAWGLGEWGTKGSGRAKELKERRSKRRNDSDAMDR
ncbi:hypothetical protein DV738_g4523, partial [Chaetothyriales sp. CBS 135597]